MPGRFRVYPSGVLSGKNDMEGISSQIRGYAEDVLSAKNALPISGGSARSLKSSLSVLYKEMREEADKVTSMKSGLEQSVGIYSGIERNLSGKKAEGTTDSPVSSDESTFAEEFWQDYGWDGLLAGSNYIGKVRKLVKGYKDTSDWKDVVRNVNDTYEFAEGAYTTFRNYRKIGRAVGTTKSMGWWGKAITGLKPLGRVSTAKNPLTRFKNNLTNKTSPFHASFESIVNDFKGKNGVGKAFASWATVAVNGALNLKSNLDEQKASNGTMSNWRVAAETVTETAIDTVLTYGAGIVVGAAVSAVLGPVAVPGIVVTALSGMLISAANAGIKKLTGKSVTEFLSDSILDTGEFVLKSVGNGAKKVTKAVAGWFKKAGNKSWRKAYAY